MLSANHFFQELTHLGHVFYTGVPCSFLTSVINVAGNQRDFPYVRATSEGEAVAIAAGAWLAGKPAVVLAQNSGLGNMLNPLTSLNNPFRIPILIVVTWRGQPGLRDEPQHELMGQITPPLLELMKVDWQIVPREGDQLRACLEAAAEAMARTSLPVALLVEHGTFGEIELSEPPLPKNPIARCRDMSVGGARPSRFAVIQRLLDIIPPSAAVIATTGKCARELYTLSDRPQHLYMVGAMGSASALGLGVALNTERTIVVLDGDGAALMRLGTFATIATHAPSRLIHVLLDNGVHDSTGGQRTVSEAIRLGDIAVACGYANVFVIDDLESLTEVFAEMVVQPGPHLLHVRIVPGSIVNLGRPRVAPFEVARRFSDFIRQPSPS